MLPLPVGFALSRLPAVAVVLVARPGFAAAALDAVPFGAGLSSSTLLAATAALLLVFVSAGVVYLSTVEWRDRRRRARLEGSAKAKRRS